VTLTKILIWLWQVTWKVAKDATQILVDHLAMERPDANNILIVSLKRHLKGGVGLEKLQAHFWRLWIFGVGVERSMQRPSYYLPRNYFASYPDKELSANYLLLLDFKKINDYAWGAVVLANIKRSMIEKSKSTSLYCFSMTLTISFNIFTLSLIFLCFKISTGLKVWWWLNCVNFFFDFSYWSHWSEADKVQLLKWFSLFSSFFPRWIWNISFWFSRFFFAIVTYLTQIIIIFTSIFSSMPCTSIKNEQHFHLST